MSLISLFSALGSLDFDEFDKILEKYELGIKMYELKKKRYELKKKRRDWIGLGHLQIDFNKRKLLVTQPRLSFLPPTKEGESNAVLIGYRNSLLLAKIDKTSKTLGLLLSNEINGAYPDRIVISGSSLRLSKLVQELKEAQFSFTENPLMPDAWRLLHETDSIQKQLEAHFACRQPVSAGESMNAFNVYEPHDYQFLPWSQIKDSYQSRLMLIRRTPYKHWIARKNPDNKWEYWQNDFQGDPLCVKWAVTQDCEKFNMDSFFALAPDYCSVKEKLPLPLDLHRVACFCSGIVPTQREGWNKYRDIPSVIQHELRDKLRFNLSH